MADIKRKHPKKVLPISFLAPIVIIKALDTIVSDEGYRNRSDLINDILRTSIKGRGITLESIPESVQLLTEALESPPASKHEILVLPVLDMELKTEEIEALKKDLKQHYTKLLKGLRGEGCFGAELLERFNTELRKRENDIRKAFALGGSFLEYDSIASPIVKMIREDPEISDNIKDQAKSALEEPLTRTKKPKK
jgi:Arc/MetJ-type ribon-helix-helix transcriptional regulator